MKVVLVDDERIAIEHIRSLIPWEQCGYEIAATATNGRSALRICQEHRPQIMIVDIRMPVMDGLQLIKAVSEQQLGVKFIVMSAFEDFEYARQAISLGDVSSYLVKHEVDRDKLMYELDKAKAAWIADERQRLHRINEQIGDALTGRDRSGTNPDVCVKPPFGVMLIQVDVPFSDVPSLGVPVDWTTPVKWDLEVSSLACSHPVWRCAAEFPVGGSQYAALFTSRNRTCRSFKEEFHQLGREVLSELMRRYGRSFSIYYVIESSEARPLSRAYLKAGTAAFHAVFSGREMLVCADDLPLPVDGGSRSHRQVRFDTLHEEMKQPGTAKWKALSGSCLRKFAFPIGTCGACTRCSAGSTECWMNSGRNGVFLNWIRWIR
ncbi:MAG: two component transcriptional regulator, AraC family [Cohnella sp.]|nr:two component transcriptional regulator, AraC family [Cohnella sp.]